MHTMSVLTSWSQTEAKISTVKLGVGMDTKGTESSVRMTEVSVLQRQRSFLVKPVVPSSQCYYMRLVFAEGFKVMLHGTIRNDNF